MIKPDCSERCAVTAHVKKEKLEHRKFWLDMRNKIVLEEGDQILNRVLRMAVGSSSLEIWKT